MLLAGSQNLQAMGRRDAEKDKFPDYNRLEIHHTRPPESPLVSTEAVPSLSPVVKSQKPSPAEMNPDPMVPKPPPKAIPMFKSDDPEPALPDVMNSTLISTPLAH